LYNARELRCHLERQFHDGMTWDAFLRGDIHIDHIVPKKLYNHDNLEEVRACWCLSNLRPLWADANLAKQDSRQFLL